MIKFGISKDYVPSWGVVQAIREIYQNFIDYGEFTTSIVKLTEDRTQVTLRSDFKPDNWEFLKIGFSKKGVDSIGNHGEGLKLAGLIFMREGLKFRIQSSLGSVRPTLYTDPDLGECYGLSNNNLEVHHEFSVMFEAHPKDLEIFTEGYLKDEDRLHKTRYGDIVNRKKGHVYVGGLYVCHISTLKYSFDFKPSMVELSRDRDAPSTWDIQYYANQIVSGCIDELDIKVSDVTADEFKQGNIPEVLRSKFRPIIGDSGRVYMKSGKTLVTDSSTVSKIMRSPAVASRVKTLIHKCKPKSNKAPSTLLTHLRNKVSYSLSTPELAEFDSIIKTSRKWKTK